MEIIAALFAMGIACLVVVILILVFRQVALWYWRVNEMHHELADMNKALNAVQDRLNEIAGLLRDANRRDTP